MASKPFDKTKIDCAQAFLMFMLTAGDCIRTAAALDLDPDVVRALAADEGWADKVRRVSVMSKSSKPGDYEKSVNRALNFIQSQQLREQVNRLLRSVTDMTDEELLSRACVRTKDGGNQLSAKFLVDLTSAAEAVHRMTYNSLGDTVTERCESAGSGPDSTSNANAMHAAIIASLSNPSADPGPITQRLIAEANVKATEIASAIPQPNITAARKTHRTNSFHRSPSGKTSNASR